MTDSVFSTEQAARAEAAKIAGVLLRTNGGLAAGQGQPGKVEDILQLANWIVNEPTVVHFGEVRGGGGGSTYGSGATGAGGSTGSRPPK